ncbi:MAG TPA: DNA-3-methyladenine glycosylase [Solirubrobacteraceae bacterium]|nr:DNA-3-methyladenine glycosylase [Solirubrobacteraceae bacterium]
MRVLREGFYARPVVEVARELIGCVVEHAGAAGVIVETEAYHDSEPACHAFAGLTPRTQTLFGPPGRAYVYRSYGVHAMLNAVSEATGSGAAVLIRALQPIAGLEAMRSRRGARPLRTSGLPERHGLAPGDGLGDALRDEDLCSGPGKLTQALGIELSENGCSLARGPVVIGAASAAWRAAPVVTGPRVGITHAAELPWRFCVAGNPNVSRPRPRIGDGSVSWRELASRGVAAAQASGSAAWLSS